MAHCRSLVFRWKEAWRCRLGQLSAVQSCCSSAFILNICGVWRSGNGGVGSYPWIPLFRSPLGLLTSVASIAILPVAANAELIHRYGHRSELSTQIGAILTAATTVLAVWALFEVKELRDQAVDTETPQSGRDKMQNSRRQA